MTQQDDTVPYQRLIDHFDRPNDSPGEGFDPDSLPDGEVRELYDTVMADYYSHIPAYPSNSPKEKMKFDLINRMRQNNDALAVEAQKDGMRAPELLETVDTKQLTSKDIKKIIGAYRSLRPIGRTSKHP